MKEIRKPGAPIGSRNAAKSDGPFKAQIPFRTTPEQKQAIELAAGSEGMNAWIRVAVQERLDRLEEIARYSQLFQE